MKVPGRRKKSSGEGKVKAPRRPSNPSKEVSDGWQNNRCFEPLRGEVASLSHYGGEGEVVSLQLGKTGEDGRGGKGREEEGGGTLWC